MLIFGGVLNNDHHLYTPFLEVTDIEVDTFQNLLVVVAGCNRYILPVLLDVDTASQNHLLSLHHPKKLGILHPTGNLNIHIPSPKLK